MTDEDRELLEMAAKAAGVVGEFVTGYGSGDFYYQGNQDGILIQNSQGELTVWNPLTDDGDALRLAVRLNFFSEYSPEFESELSDTYGADDKYAATRRAIVRAAAEIGRRMK